MEENIRSNSKGQHQGAKEGEYKNTETSVNNASYFDDAYASEVEDEMANEEAKSEKEKETGKGGKQR